MADMTTLEVEADVSESAVGKVALDQPCEVQLDALPDVRFRGVVGRMVPTVDRAKATVTVKVRFLDKDPRILPEMSAKVAFLSQPIPEDLRSRRTVIQPSAVVERGGRSVVFLLRDARAVETPVTIGGRIGELLEITHGVEPGDRVVAAPPVKLHDGERVALPAAAN
jgi:multidrug efflux pump subunit AcrA (membrane-fusion protein)